MHVTLHFIGEADADQVRQALTAVRCRRFEVSLHGVGQFSVSGGQRILWVGVNKVAGLLNLHANCGQALAAIDIELERRSFVPHVTVARTSKAAQQSIVRRFLQRGAERDFGTFEATHFVLYNSVVGNRGSQYDAIETYALN